MKIRKYLLSLFLPLACICSTSAQVDQHAYPQKLVEAMAVVSQQQPQTSGLRLAIQQVEQAHLEVSALDAGSDYGASLNHYIKSLLALGRYPHPDTLGVLATAIDHGDARVRTSALRTLRGGAANEDPHAPLLDMVSTLITADPDPKVRLEAFEVYSRWGDPDRLVSIAGVLVGEQGPLQAMAVREWLRIENERRAAELGASQWQN